MLTQEQYETLLQELDQRPLAEEEPDQPAVADWKNSYRLCGKH